MKKFDSRFKIGTLVKVGGNDEWRKITEIHETRYWIKLEGNYGGSWQRNHVTTFTNKSFIEIKE